MISAREAQQKIFEHVKWTGTEAVPLGDALNRFLAGPVIAPISLPIFDNTAMDGFAVHSGDAQSASQASPVSLKVIGTIAAGNPRCASEGSGSAFRIMTGAPMPDGADAVVPFEEALSQGGNCLISRPVTSGENIRRAGEDVRRGESIFESGEKITPRSIALLAALGISRVGVFRRPRVKIVSTGNEIVDPGRPLSYGKIYNSNGPALIAALREIGIESESVVKAGDSEEDLKKILRKNLDADVLITVGGVSAGDYDLIPKVLEDLGAKIIFHKVAIKPGKPLLFAQFQKFDGLARLEGCLVFALPGNPVSALMVFERFVRPALFKMMGARAYFRTPHQAVAVQDLKGTEGKEDFLRGMVAYENGRYTARSAGSQGSAMLASLARANAVLVIPAETKRIAKGETVAFEFLSEDL